MDVLDKTTIEDKGNKLDYDHNVDVDEILSVMPQEIDPYEDLSFHGEKF